MLATFKIGKKLVDVDLSKPLDISIPLKSSSRNPIAWNMEKPKIEPVKSEGWVGKVTKGASINFNTITFNPHAHGTHTECIGHITPEFHSVNDALKNFFYLAEVISILPETAGEDSVISEAQLKLHLKNKQPEAIIIRTLPNTSTKNIIQFVIYNIYFTSSSGIVFKFCIFKIKTTNSNNVFCTMIMP